MQIRMQVPAGTERTLDLDTGWSGPVQTRVQEPERSPNREWTGAETDAGVAAGTHPRGNATPVKTQPDEPEWTPTREKHANKQTHPHNSELTPERVQTPTQEPSPERALDRQTTPVQSQAHAESERAPTRER